MKPIVFGLLLIGLLAAMPGLGNATEKGLLLYFPFEEGKGEAAVDGSGNGNVGAAVHSKNKLTTTWGEVRSIHINLRVNS
ncbi:hypothetical protein FJZ31_36255 [Candidatus Poribacteria bacterium]|nr:hypothetical protein [Candidatus Poribacteria bacterium]